MLATAFPSVTEALATLKLTIFRPSSECRVNGAGAVRP